jgi:hypothetical protein
MKASPIIMALGVLSLAVSTTGASSNMAAGAATSHPTKRVTLPPSKLPVIETQPTSTTVALGLTATLNATAKGSPQVQWYSSVQGSDIWTPILGGTQSQLEFAVDAETNSEQYEAVFTNRYGSTTSKPVSVMAYQTMPTWSGYMATGEMNTVFTNASATWTVPTVTCSPASNTGALQWVGIDGYRSITVEQVGSETSCVNGLPQYSAWFEMWGDLSLNNGFWINYPGIVKPGDKMSGSVSVRGGTWTLSLEDVTQNWWYYKTVVSPNPVPQQVSAEAIVERPLVCAGVGACVNGTMAELSPVIFTSTNFVSSDPSGVSVTPAIMDLLNSPVLTPSLLSPTGAFSVTETQ